MTAMPLPARRPFRVPLPGGRVLDLGSRPLVMGIVNVTPDSFADTVHIVDPEAALDAALRMEDEGADLIDVGGESTRPGADPVSAEEDEKRLEGHQSQVLSLQSVVFSHQS